MEHKIERESVMRTRVADENRSAVELLPPHQPDGSRIGVNYVDAYLQPLNVELDSGLAITCRRKGLKVTITVGDRTGEAIINRLEDGPDPENMLRVALAAAADRAGTPLSVEDGGLYLELA